MIFHKRYLNFAFPSYGAVLVLTVK